MRILQKPVSGSPFPKNAHFGMNYIDGEWRPSKEGYEIDVYDPSNIELLASVPRSSKTDVKQAVEAAVAAKDIWRRFEIPDRAALLYRFAELVESNAERIAIIEARDTGHYYRKALELVQATPMWIRFHAGLIDKLRGSSIPALGKRVNFTQLVPLGVTAHIVPWNYPFLLYARSVMPALACGNTVILKPAEETPLSATIFSELIEEAGFPVGVFNLVQGTGPEAGAALCADPQVDGITFTGSVETGKSVMRAAAGNITKVNLELGGKSPHIICADACIDSAVEAATQAILSHAGQVCIAGSRLFLHEEIYDTFLDRLVKKFQSAKLGPLFDPETTMGPLVSERQSKRVQRYVDSAVSEGANLLIGGATADVPGCPGGYFFEPTILTDVQSGMTVAREEIFGPVLCVMRWKDEAELIKQANSTDFGLAAGIWTRDIYRAMRLRDELQSGVIFVNDWFGEVPWSPHGGMKRSGIGREEGLETIQSYTQIKNTMINYQDDLHATSWDNGPL